MNAPLARVICADPPWQHRDRRGAKGASAKYPTMPLHEIMRFPLPDIANNAALFLWRLAEMQQEALDVIKAWGFALKTEIIWIKKTPGGLVHFGQGHYTRGAHETCLLATRGSVEVDSHSVRSVFEVPDAFEAATGEHSEKPEYFYREIVEKLFPLDKDFGHYELFARREREGWICQGNEVGKLPPAPAVTVVLPAGTQVAKVGVDFAVGSDESVMVTSDGEVLDPKDPAVINYSQICTDLAKRGIVVSLQTFAGFTEMQRLVVRSFLEQDTFVLSDIPPFLEAFYVQLASDADLGGGCAACGRGAELVAGEEFKHTGEGVHCRGKMGAETAPEEPKAAEEAPKRGRGGRPRKAPGLSPTPNGPPGPSNGHGTFPPSAWAVARDAAERGSPVEQFAP